MPLYVYHCDQCDQDFEKMVRFSEADRPQECPSCHDTHTHKRITTFASTGSSSSSSGSTTSSGCGSSGRFT